MGRMRSLGSQTTNPDTMKASTIVKHHNQAAQGLSWQRYLILIKICAAGKKGITQSNIAGHKWACDASHIRAAFRMFEAARLVTLELEPQRAAGKRANRAYATDLAYQFLGLEHETEETCLQGITKSQKAKLKLQQAA